MAECKPLVTSLARPSRTSLSAAAMGYRLLAAGLLMVSGVIDYDRLGPALRAASDRAPNLSREPTI